MIFTAGPEAYSETCQTPTMEHFAKIVKGYLFFAKYTILDVWQGSDWLEYASEDYWIITTVKRCNSRYMIIGSSKNTPWKSVPARKTSPQKIGPSPEFFCEIFNLLFHFFDSK